MPYQTPITVKTALDRIWKHEYVLLAIQREFVWNPKQICKLFDSLMQGFPVGSFLFWKIEPKTAKNFRFFDFSREYHQRDNPHCPPLGKAPQGLVLSYSDLLLSIATAQWEERDVRSESNTLVDSLNATGLGFNFSKDFVLEAGLMLSDIASVGFKVENFDRNNMKKLESNWPSVAETLRMTIRLVWQVLDYRATRLMPTARCCPSRITCTEMCRRAHGAYAYRR